jgi:hypothetical protein
MGRVSLELREKTKKGTRFRDHLKSIRMIDRDPENKFNYPAVKM